MTTIKPISTGDTLTMTNPSPNSKYSSTKDITSKVLLKRMAADMANLLLNLDVEPDSVELLETEKERIEQRRADLVIRARPRQSPEKVILHIEIQNNNQATIAWRMLRYYQDIRAEHGEPIQQYLLYIGKQRCSMPQTIQEPNLTYQYTLVDMHTVDCNTLLERNTPDALVLAILCDFKGRPAEAVVREIGTRLRLLLHNDDKGFLDYFSMLEILGQNRDLEQPLKETKTMLTQIDVSRLPSYQWGWEDSQKASKAELAEKENLLKQMLQEKQHALQEKQHALQEKQSALQEKQHALQEKAQQTARLVRKMHLSGMEAAQIADFLEMPLAEVVALCANP